MKKVISLFFLVSATLLVSSCRHDDGVSYYGACHPSLSVHSSDGNDSQIKDVVVYIYEPGGTLIGHHSTNVATAFNVRNYIKYGSIKVVSWGNATGDDAPQILSPPTLDRPITEHTLQEMQMDSIFNGNSLTRTPADLFHGVQEISFEQTRGSINANRDSVTKVYVNRAVASFILTVKNIAQRFGRPENRYNVLIRHPYNGLDFGGNPIGDQSISLAEVSYDRLSDQLTSSINVALPTGDKGLVIEIYSDNNLIYTATADKLGNLISLYPNKLQNILIDFDEDYGVTLVPSEWDDVLIFQDFE